METNPKIQYFPKNIVFAAVGLHFAWKRIANVMTYILLNGNHPKIQYLPENIVFAVVGLLFVWKRIANVMAYTY